MSKVPVIDVAALRAGDPDGSAAAAAALDRACREVGFFAVSSHGISAALPAAVRVIGRAFFALPDAAKHEIERPPARTSRGWSWVGDRLPWMPAFAGMTEKNSLARAPTAG